MRSSRYAKHADDHEKSSAQQDGSHRDAKEQSGLDPALDIRNNHHKRDDLKIGKAEKRSGLLYRLQEVHGEHRLESFPFPFRQREQADHDQKKHDDGVKTPSRA